jgi:2-polyprenyl-3-methyl-5-hydroxy-6-metoxy-1,4-benzoquinol methylase
MDNTYEHFSKVSDKWSDRYGNRPQNIWDLDLVMRRENLHLMLQPILKAHAGQRIDILDAGCGTGDALDGISRQEINVTGFDLVAEMVEVAQSRNPKDSYRQASFHDLPFDRGSKDIVICLGVLEYLDDVPSALKAIRDELKDEGQLIVSFPNAASYARIASRWAVGIEEVAATLIRRLQGRKRQTTLPKYRHQSWTLPAVETALGEAGFSVSQVLFNTVGIAGRIGKLGVAMRFSRWWTERFRYDRGKGERFAMTMLVQATKQ